jgi:hypothetical protein
MVTVAVAVISVLNTPWGAFGLDSHAYWGAWADGLYERAPATLDAFLYSPAFAQVIWPLTLLPWLAFGILWSTAATLAFLHLFRPLGWRWAVPLTACCLPEILTGNVFWVLALVAAYGLRWPALWAVPLLTKLTPALGPIWFLTRREWRSLGISVAATVLVLAVSALVSPHEWTAWVRFLRDHDQMASASLGLPGVPPPWVRIPLAVTLTVWAALTNRRWGLPAAMVLATPVFGVAALTILAAIPRLAQPPAAAGIAANAPGAVVARPTLLGWER